MPEAQPDYLGKQHKHQGEDVLRQVSLALRIGFGQGLVDTNPVFRFNFPVLALACPLRKADLPFAPRYFCP